MNDKDFLALRKKIIKYLKERLGPRLLSHSLGVEAAAVQIAAASSNYRLIKKCSIAALLHDAAKCLALREMQSAIKSSRYRPGSKVLAKEGLLHGHVSAHIARNVFKINDKSIIWAIRRHTLGRLNMNVLEKIIFISDYIEPHRNFEGIEALRKKVYSALFFEGIDHALILVVRDKIRTLSAMNIEIEKILLDINDRLGAALNL